MQPLHKYWQQVSFSLKHKTQKVYCPFILSFMFSLICFFLLLVYICIKANVFPYFISSRWSIIAAQLPGRTDNDIKNYWNTRLKKKLLGKRKQSNRLSSTSQVDSKNEFDNSYSQALSNSAFERLQLHMQLQSLQSPFSIYNSPSVFPKLHPLQEKMIHQTLRCSNENPRSLMQQVLTSPQSLLDQQKAQFYEPTTTLQEQEEYPNPKMDELENSFNGISTSDSSIGFTTGSNCNLFVGHKPDSIHEQLNGGTQSASTFQAELESFLNNKSACGFVPQDQDQIAEFDCFKEVDGAKDIMLWWPSSNDFDSKSASLNSWDSASVLQSEMFQDYALGYNM